ncbi:hypothetical protein ACHQM5_004868 [Ranunculus cassubicifolius]
MADQTPIDPFKALNITLNPDGTFTRHSEPPIIPTLPSSNLANTVKYTDIRLNPIKNMYIRAYQPLIHPSNSKLPLIIFFHGGGFILFSATIPPYHNSCMHMASDLPAIILSVDYALAPENRLPSAYEDALEVIHWVKTQAFKGELEYEFFEHVDFSKCFVMGSSSGANITFQVGLSQAHDIEPFRIDGLIMIQPFFGGVDRSESELRLVNDAVLPLCVTDLMWEYSLPVGADRDHEYCNVTSESAHKKNVEGIKRFPRCYVRGHGGDPLLDKQKLFVEMLEKDGVCVVKDFSEDGFHACELFDLNKAKELVAGVKGFIYSSSAC